MNDTGDSWPHLEVEMSKVNVTSQKLTASVETSPEEMRLHPNHDFEFPNNGCFRRLFRTFNF